MKGEIQDRNTLRNFFLRGQIPRQEHFADLVESSINLADDGMKKPEGGALALQASKDGTQDVLLLFQDFAASDIPDWKISLNATGNPADKIKGLAITKGDGTSRLFIDAETGDIGIGINNPKQKLHVKGNAILNNAFIGDAGHGANWAGFTHKSSIGKGKYGLLHSNNGAYTYLNIVSGSKGSIRFNVDNNVKMLMTDKGKVGINIDIPEARLHVNGNTILKNTFIGDVGHGVNWAGFSHKSSVGKGKYGLLQSYNGAFTYLNIKSGAASGNGSIRFNVDNRVKLLMTETGDIGIGIDKPEEKLHVNGNVKIDTTKIGLNIPLLIRNLDMTVGNTAGIGFLVEQAFGKKPKVAKAAIVHERKLGWGVGDLHFLLNNDGHSASGADMNDAKMTITRDGNIGINNKDPKRKLHIHEGHVLVTSSGASNRNARVFLSNSTIPANSFMLGGVYKNHLYFYFKDDKGNVYGHKLRGTILHDGF